MTLDTKVISRLNKLIILVYENRIIANGRLQRIRIIANLCKEGLSTFMISILTHLKSSLNPLTAGAAHIRVFIFYQHIKYHILNMLKIKCDIKQQNLKRVDLHFVESE